VSPPDEVACQDAIWQTEPEKRVDVRRISWRNQIRRQNIIGDEFDADCGDKRVANCKVRPILKLIYLVFASEFRTPMAYFGSLRKSSIPLTWLWNKYLGLV